TPHGTRWYLRWSLDSRPIGSAEGMNAGPGTGGRTTETARPMEATERSHGHLGGAVRGRVGHRGNSHRSGVRIRVVVGGGDRLEYRPAVARASAIRPGLVAGGRDRKSTRLNSRHTV